MKTMEIKWIKRLTLCTYNQTNFNTSQAYIVQSHARSLRTHESARMLLLGDQRASKQLNKHMMEKKEAKTILNFE